MTIPESFYLQRLRFCFRAHTAISFPKGVYPPDAFNGAFGQALMSNECMMAHKPDETPCASCFLNRRCAFPCLMAVQGLPPRPLPRKYRDHPKPYVISAPEISNNIPKNGTFFIDMTIVGSAVQHFAAVLKAMKALGSMGLGSIPPGKKSSNSKAGKSELQWVATIDANGQSETIYANNSLLGSINSKIINAADFAPQKPKTKKIQIELLTPLSLPDLHNKDFSLEHLALLAARRVGLLNYLYCNGAETEWEPHFDTLTQPSEIILNPQEYVSGSRRYENKRKLKGQSGVLCYKGEVSHFKPLLKMASLLHIGRETSAGFGFFALH